MDTTRDESHGEPPLRRPKRAPREVEFHLTLSEEDRELLDRLAQRMNCSRTETIARALHLLRVVQEKADGRAP